MAEPDPFIETMFKKPIIIIEEEALLKEILKIPNDQYTCSECNLVPEIIDLNFDKDEIVINCINHGEMRLNLINYFQKEYNYLYYNVICEAGERVQKEHLDNIFVYCPKCDKYLCQSCNNDHPHKFSVLQVNELNTKCHTHVYKDYFRYCSYCNKHYCNLDTHKCQNPQIKSFENPSKEDIEVIKKKRDKFLYLYKILDTILTTYEKHPSNYFNCINVINVAQKVNINRNEMLLDKIDGLEDKILYILNEKFQTKLNLDEIIVDLSGKNIGDKELDLITELNFKNAKELNFSNNNIKDISKFGKLKAPNLKKLGLSFNSINDISKIDKIASNLTNLEVLDLSNNQIENADILKKKIFEKIKEINLENNKIVKEEIESIKRIIKETINKNREFKLVYRFDKLEEKIKIFGEKFVENNKNNCKIYINNEEQELNEYYLVKKDAIDYDIQDNALNIKLIVNEDINITNMSYMFHNCSSLLSLPDIYNFDISKVIDMSGLFFGCKSLLSLSDLSRWDTSNVTDMRNIFAECESLFCLPDISKWNTSNVTNMSSMFYKCVKLVFLPPINKWNTSNVIDMNHMFYKCISLLSLPDISRWNTANVNNISYMFSCCTSLTSLPDLSKWDTSKITNMVYLFYGLNTLKELPNISNWNTSTINNMSGLFFGCSSLNSLPDISKWDTSKVKDMSLLFSKCSSLKSFPNISKWIIGKDICLKEMFYNCNQEIIPNKFK